MIVASTSAPSSALAAQVKVPVLLQVGRLDVLMANGNVCADARHYRESRAVTAIELPNAAHNLALHLNAHEGWGYIDRWLAQYCR